jgi:hypothetical protein
MDDLKKKVRTAVQQFWKTREKQSASQGRNRGQRDAGFRTAVTGGKHLDGFITLCRDLLIEAGLASVHLYWNNRRTTRLLSAREILGLACRGR